MDGRLGKERLGAARLGDLGAVQVIPISATLAGQGTLAAAALLHVQAATQLVGQGAIAAAARVAVILTAPLAGAGTSTASALLTIPAAGTLPGSGSLNAQATIPGETEPVVPDAVLFFPPRELRRREPTAEPPRVLRVTAHLAARGTLRARLTRILTARAHLTASVALAARPIVVIGLTAALRTERARLIGRVQSETPRELREAWLREEIERMVTVRLDEHRSEISAELRRQNRRLEEERLLGLV